MVINAYTHKAVSGGHRKNAFLLIENLNGKKLKNNENANTLDIAPTILDILNIDYKKYDQLEGISLLE